MFFKSFRLAPFLLALFLVAACNTYRVKPPATTANYQNYNIGFYNVENLMDTLDNPTTDDDEFTPAGKNKWNTERYQKKLQDLGKVIQYLENPILLGLGEIENRSVVEDLVAANNLTRQYGIVHYESPDYRGIDVALLYNKERIKVIESKAINVTIPENLRPKDEGGGTRDILYLKGLFRKDTLHVFVNHFPSRRNGKEGSEPKRVYAASQLRKQIDAIRAKQPNAHIIIMGDFNDEPTDKSIAETLGALPDTLSSYPAGALVNMAYSANARGEGSYNYRGSWDCIDQIMVSNSLRKNPSFSCGDFSIGKADFLLFEDKKFGKTPNRTYGGPNYYGGYSDHLPVYITCGAPAQ